MPDVIQLVNATQLDNDMASVANAIRSKSGASSALTWPGGFVSEIGSIPTGASITGQTDVTVKAMENIAQGDTLYIYMVMQAIFWPNTLPVGAGYSCAFSPDGTRLAVSHLNSPYITVYDTTTTPYTKLANPDTLPAGSGNGCAFSPDGTRLAVAHQNSPNITIYDTTTTPYTKLANPGTLPAGTGNGCAFSPDGAWLAVGHDASPYITIYNGSNQARAEKASNKSMSSKGGSYGYAKSSITSGSTGTAAVLFEP